MAEATVAYVDKFGLDFQRFSSAIRRDFNAIRSWDQYVYIST